MTKLDTQLLNFLANYTLRVAVDTANGGEVDYKDIIRDEIIPELKSIFNYEDLAPLPERKEAFRLRCLERLGDYTEAEITSFYNHWIAMGEKDRKMKFEKEKTFMLSGRLATWRTLSKKFSIQGSVMKSKKFQ